MCEHKERYYGFMEYLTGYGYVTVIHDHRGHGASVKDKTDLGLSLIHIFNNNFYNFGLYIGICLLFSYRGNS